MKDLFHISIGFILGSLFTAILIIVLQSIAQQHNAIPLQQVQAAFAL